MNEIIGEQLTKDNIEDAVLCGGISYAGKENSFLKSEQYEKWFYDLILNIQLGKKHFDRLQLTFAISEGEKGYVLTKSPSTIFKDWIIEVYRPAIHTQAIDILREQARCALELILNKGLRRKKVFGGEEAGWWWEWRLGKRSKYFNVFFIPTRPRGLSNWKVLPGWKILYYHECFEEVMR